MPLRVYRVCRARCARLDGEGARRVGGRWNPAGHAVVCIAGSIAAVLPEDISAVTGQDLRLRAGLERYSPQALGDGQIDSQETAVLKFASAIVPGEHLYLQNPSHPDFARIAVEPPALFHFDSRLFP